MFKIGDIVRIVQNNSGPMWSEYIGTKWVIEQVIDGECLLQDFKEDCAWWKFEELEHTLLTKNVAAKLLLTKGKL